MDRVRIGFSLGFTEMSSIRISFNNRPRDRFVFRVGNVLGYCRSSDSVWVRDRVWLSVTDRFSLRFRHRF